MGSNIRRKQHRYEQQVICIAGANGLIGRTLVNYFVNLNFRVVACDLKFDDMFQYIENKSESKMDLITSVKTNLLSEVEVEKIFTILNTKVTHLVNCCYPRNKNYGRDLLSVKSSDFNENVSMNLSAYFIIMKSAAEFFSKNGGGSIVNFSSIYGEIAPKFNIYEGTEMTMPVEYAPVKAGIQHMSKYFAKYFLKFDVNINSILPGGVFANQDSKFIENYERNTNSFGMLEAEELCEAVEFLLFARNITGQNLIIDNGFTL